jgi:hypothetical protein
MELSAKVPFALPDLKSIDGGGNLNSHGCLRWKVGGARKRPPRINILPIGNGYEPHL